jgi:hypothetical protein
MIYMKKPLLLMMLCVMLVFTLGQSAWAFKDTSSNPNADKIAALKAAGIISGEAEDVFNPEGELTYAAGISMLVKGLDVSLARFLFMKAPLASDFFTHVKDDEWYSEAFIIAHVNGLDIPKDVKPDQIMTREQYAHHLFRAIEANGEHAYTEQFIMIEDEKDITPAYMNSIQKLLITHIVSLDKEQKFHPQSQINRGEAAGWLHDAREFVKKMAEIPVEPEPEPNPLTDQKLESKSVSSQINEVTVTANAPHPGYGIRIASIVFSEKQAIIYTEPALPDPDKMYPQVVTSVKAVTYISSDYKAVLADAAHSVPGSTGGGDDSVSSSGPLSDDE